jgi:uncharacterized protein
MVGNKGALVSRQSQSCEAAQVAEKSKGEMVVISEDLVEVIRKGFALPLDGIHGASHWARVRDNGLRLARLTGANPEVVELFAFLHDSKRLSDGADPGHGRRAAEFARILRGSLVTLAGEDFEHLVFACEYHSAGLTEADITVQTCWDADRLDLGRIGVEPEKRNLCTSVARELAVAGGTFLRTEGYHS